MKGAALLRAAPALSSRGAVCNPGSLADYGAVSPRGSLPHHDVDRVGDQGAPTLIVWIGATLGRGRGGSTAPIHHHEDKSWRLGHSGGRYRLGVIGEQRTGGCDAGRGIVASEFFDKRVNRLVLRAGNLFRSAPFVIL